jgi:transposase
MARQADVLEFRLGDQQELEGRLRRSTTGKSEACRARIVLMSSQGKRAMEIARVLGVVPSTVYTWRQRSGRDGLEGWRDRGRPGRPRTLSAAKVREFLELTTKRILKRRPTGAGA